MSGITRTGALLALASLLLPIAARSQAPKEEEKKDGGTTKISIEVTAGEDPKPVDNASVYVKYVRERTFARDKHIEMNLKTNRQGKVRVPEIPQGKILIQVIAPGWKTFGRWYEINETEKTIKIHLKPPPRWY